MSIAQVIQFMQKTAEDETLRQKLEELLGVGDGDISSIKELDTEEAQALKGAKGSLVIELANQHGFDFSFHELMTVVDAFEQRQLLKLSPEDFSQITGLTDGDRKPNALFSWSKKAIKFFSVSRRNHSPVPPTQPAIDEKITANVIEFMQKTAEDEYLKKQLESLLGVGDGDISSHYELDAQEAEALKSQQSALVVELADQYGYQFSSAELIGVVELFENRQSKDLDRESLMMQFLA
jgi:uncharacterized protein YihD (DUF1040 family)